MVNFPWYRRNAQAQSEAQPATERERFYLRAVVSLLSLLKEALSAVRSRPEELEKETELLNALRAEFEQQEGEAGPRIDKLEIRLRKEGDHLRQYLARQRMASAAREQELSNVVSLLTRSMGEATRDNATFYQNIRAEGERIAEASHTDDLHKLKSVLRVASQKLTVLVDHKESDDQSRIDALSNQVEELKTELREARATAQLDGLTGCLNRRSFDHEISDRISRYAGTRKRFALLMFDLDNFKRINDSYGHQVGDRVLMSFAQRCQAMLRPEDQLARFGGEEFAVILDGVSLRNAQKRAQGICEAMAGSRYTLDDSENPRQLAVTVSVGVAELRRGDSVDSLVKRADDALYLAKNQGKNRAVSERELEV